jgi:uncharacterized membrane protein
LSFDWNIVAISVVSVSLLVFDRYYSMTPYKYWDRVILYLFVPLFVIIVVCREHPRLYGFTLATGKPALFSRCSALAS